jgi:ankyrin repeat protein
MSSSFTTKEEEEKEEKEEKEFIDALFSSARYGDVEDIKTILNHIVSNGKVDDEEKNTLRINNNFVNFQDENGRTALFYACANGHTDAVEVLVNEFNANIMNTTNTDESTCLHWACLNGHEKVVKFLLENAGVQSEQERTNADGRSHAQRSTGVRESNHGLNVRRRRRRK